MPREDIGKMFEYIVDDNVWIIDGIDRYVVKEKKGGKPIAICNSMAEAELIASALSDYSSSNGFPSTRNVRTPRNDTLLRSIEDCIRRGRQSSTDRALDGMCIIGEYGPCNRHAVGKCPEYHKSMNMGKNGCNFELQSLRLEFPNHDVFRLKLNRELNLKKIEDSIE